jgi:hypothetical protein
MNEGIQLPKYEKFMLVSSVFHFHFICAQLQNLQSLGVTVDNKHNTLITRDIRLIAIEISFKL